MSINRIDIVIDKCTYVKYRTLKNTLLRSILQKDIPTKLEQQKHIRTKWCIY